MANPTTNYGFVLPTATDLVTDLPADFEVALQGVDTRLKALQPGTTLGDLAYSSATANTNTRLGIGTSGQLLSVSGGGVPAWATVTTGSMTLLSTTTLNTTTISITSISQDYKKLVGYIKNPRPSAAANYNLRYNNISTATYSSTRYGDTGVNSVVAPADTSISFMPDVKNAASTGFIVFEIDDYANTTTIKVTNITGFANNNSVSGDYSIKASVSFSTATSAISELNLFVGASQTSGTIELYGVK